LQPCLEAGTGTSGVAGIRTTVLSGDPNKAGLYTIRLFIPSHTVIKPHHHRDDRVATVVSGIWYIGYGVKRDTPRSRRCHRGFRAIGLSISSLPVADAGADLPSPPPRDDGGSSARPRARGENAPNIYHAVATCADRPRR
jgi:hypothetical protein